MKIIFTILCFGFFLMSCSKKEQVTKVDEPTESEVVETNDKVVDSANNPQPEEPDISAENPLPTNGAFVSGDREIFVEFKIDERKEQIATISEIGKEKIELYQSINAPKTFEDRSIGIWFTLNNQGLELTESTKVSQFKRK